MKRERGKRRAAEMKGRGQEETERGGEREEGEEREKDDRRHEGRRRMGGGVKRGKK